MPKKRQERKKTTKIPYARGFKIPSDSDKLKAIKRTKLEDIELTFQPNQELFKELPPPNTKYDWLAVYAERGQTCSEYIKTNPWLSRKPVRGLSSKAFSPKGSTICEKYPEAKAYIIPVGKLDFGDIDTIKELVRYASIFYNIPIKVLDPFEVVVDVKKGQTFWQSTDGELIMIKSRFHKKTKRFQFLIDSCLKEISSRIPDDALFVIALTMEELYADKRDLFVSGMASGASRSAIFSLKRYDPTLKFCTEFWHKYEENACRVDERWNLLLKRSCTLLVHEMGHLLGIGHCIYFDCCMNGSGHLEEDIRQSMHLCPVDLRKLKILCGIDVKERYRKLQEFFKEFKFHTEENWITKRLEQLSQ
ncbi:unnamed protein product [Dimorphilus gyrociliatus]|uniref:Uncharacterized protein n=1 Tax=Dimorphilus gyrociliatus TaxID=2664684 RepID=A0A7I8VB53_9ANNE|nr:unnamed protein product [Dimorphilus gyrociliatus]